MNEQHFFCSSIWHCIYMFLYGRDCMCLSAVNRTFRKEFRSLCKWRRPVFRGFPYHFCSSEAIRHLRLRGYSASYARFLHYKNTVSTRKQNNIFIFPWECRNYIQSYPMGYYRIDVNKYIVEHLEMCRDSQCRCHISVPAWIMWIKRMIQQCKPYLRAPFFYQKLDPLLLE